MPSTPTTRSTRRPARRLVRWVPVLALAAGAAVYSPGSEAAPSGTLTVTPTQAAPGEPLKLTGSLPTAVRRPIVVQRGMRGVWSDVRHRKTNAAGGFTVRIPKNGMPSDPYRVIAPRVVIDGHAYPAVATPVRTVKTLEPDVRVALSDSIASVGQVVTLTATGTPVRPGRPLTLQLRTSPTTWKTISASVEGPHGQASFALPPAAAGVSVYRVVAEAWKGAGWYPSFPIPLTTNATGRKGK